MDNFSIILLFVSIIAVEALVELLTKASIFGFIREFIHSRYEKNKVYGFFDQLVHCPYCASVWVGFFVLVLIMIGTGFKGKYELTGNLIVDSFLFFIVLHRLSNYLHDFMDSFRESNFE